MISTISTISAIGSAGNYTLNATLTASAVSAAIGSVSFLDTTNGGYALATVPLIPGSSTLAFTNSANPVTQSYPTKVVTGDFNGDGKPDIAVANEYSNSVTILLGNGDGTFTVAASPVTGGDPVALAVGDFNADGKTDLAVVNANSNSVTILLGNGDGTFTAASAAPATGTNPVAIVTADFNGDGIADLAVTNGVSNNVTILLGKGDGTFTTVAVSPATGQTPIGIVSADFNGDGKADLAIANETTSTLTVLLGNGDGTFTAATSPSAGHNPTSLVEGDFNGDGIADLAATDFQGNIVTVLLGKGDGTFSQISTPSTGSNPIGSTVGDFNGDGKLDIAVANYGGYGYQSTTILYGNGDGNFTSKMLTPATYYPVSLAAADFNGDGLTDLTETALGPMQTTGTEEVLLSQITTTATGSATGISPVGNTTHYVDAAYAGNSTYGPSTSSTVALTAKPQTTATTLAVNPQSAGYGQAVTLTATISPSTAQAHSTSGTVTFYLGVAGTGTVLGNAVVSNGAAVFTTNGLPPGSDSITCVFSGDANFVTSNCAPVTAYVAGPQTITFSQPTSPAYAGTSVLLTATASSGLPVTYTVVSGPANISGSVLTYTGAGTVVVEADQGGNASYSAAAPVRDTVTVNLLSEPVSTQSGVVTTLVTFSTQGAFTNINVLTQGAPNRDFAFATGGSCTIGTIYSAGQTCTVNFTFKPTRPGLRFGGITLTTAAAVTLANAYIYGLGVGPQVIYTPGTQSTFGSGFTFASGVAVDSNGNAYVSDQGTNAVYEVPVGGGTQRSLGTFFEPDDVAVDGSGNVFVIYGQNRTSLAEIYAVNGVIPANPNINVILTSLNGLNGMKVDGNGDIFLAASFNTVVGSAVMEVPAINGSIPANPTVITLVSNVGSPTGVAIDQSGNVYFSDETGNNAYEIYAVNGVIPANPTVTSLASNLNEPSNIDLDAAGDVFVCESDAVIELVAVNGVVAPNTAQQVAIGTNLSFPQGMAIDGSGNIYIADSGLTSAVKLDFSDTPSLTFATTPVGSTSSDSPQTIRFANGGNANLTFLSPATGTNPAISQGFTFTSNCPVLVAGTALAYALTPGNACAESISFSPVKAGQDSGYLTLIDNNLGVFNSTQNIPLNALATADATTLTLSSSPNPAYVLQSFTVTAQLTAVGGASVSGQTITLTYSVAGQTFNIPLLTNSSGSASYTLNNGLPAGSTVFNASLVANNTLQAASGSVTEVVNLNPTASVLTLAPNPPVINTTETLTATVISSTTATPVAGTVNFYDGAALVGTGTLSNGVTTATLNNLPLGQVTLSCVYSGNAVFATSSCAPITFTVEPAQDFSLSANPPSITIETQHHKTMQLTLTSIGLFSGPVAMSCAAPLPPYLTCELPGSVSVAANGSTNFNFEMDTDQILNFLAANQRPAHAVDFKRVALAMLLPLALAGFARRRKKVRSLLLITVLAIVATGLTACGDKWPQHTPPGVYTIPVVGTAVTSSGKILTHTLDITLTVTP